MLTSFQVILTSLLTVDVVVVRPEGVGGNCASVNGRAATPNRVLKVFIAGRGTDDKAC